MAKSDRRRPAKSRAERGRDRRMQKILDFREFLKGSLVETEVRCGKPNCRCARGQRHRVLHLSYSQGGRTKRVYVPRPLANEVRKWIANRKKLMSVLDEVLELNVKLLKEKEVSD